jgi:branched-chain amino acid transport system permease protein
MSVTATTLISPSRQAVRPLSWLVPHAVLLLVCLGLPWVLEPSGLNLAIEVACYITLAQMWNLLAGYAGLMSIGQQLFVGVGGYTLFLGITKGGWSLLLALPAGGAARALASLPTIWLCLRLQGPYFAIATWVIADAVMLLVAKAEWLGGASGLSLPVSSVRAMADGNEARSVLFWSLAAGVMLLATVVAHRVLRSPAGLALAAIRDNQEGAMSLGVNARRVRVGVFVLAATFCALAGAVLFLQKLRISPQAAFDLGDWTATVVFIVVIGGIGRLEGAFVGTLVFFVLRAFLSDLGAWYLMLLGSVAIGTMLFAPGGLWGLWLARSGRPVFDTQRTL